MSEESPLTTTIKLPGANAPWFVVRSENAAQLDQQLNELMSLGIAATVGRAQNMLEAQFNMGMGLEARAVQAPVQQQAPAAPAQQAPQQAYPPADVSGVPFQQQPQQYAQQAPAQQYAQPQQQYQQPAPQAAAPAAPGAPMICGQPAKLVTGTKNGRQWQAWADPRPKNVTDGMERTDDPNHMGLMQGTHSFWKFIR
jgi:hypothetical protein